MPINAELQKWLAEKVVTALTPEQQQAFQSIIGTEAVSEQLNRAWMAPPDYNRKMDELKTKEAALNTELQNHIANLNQWRDGEQARVGGEVAKLQAQYNADVAALRAQIEAEGLQPSVAQPAKPNGSAAPANGQAKYMSQEDVARMVQSELSKAALLPAIVSGITERHRQLYGQVPDMTKVTDTALRTGRSLEETWREMYKVADKEQELAQADIQKKIDEGVSARLAQMQSDGAMAQQNFGGRVQPPSAIKQMLTQAKDANGNNSTNPITFAIPQPVQQQSQAVRDAVEIFNSRKYEGKPFSV